MGAAVTGTTDALKEGLKKILMVTLDFIEAQFVAAGAAAAIRALISGGFSLFADSAGFVAALAALEAARGIIGSFAVGTPFVPETGPAIVHRGERIIRERENNAMMRGDNVEPNRGFVLGRSVQTMRGNIRVSVDTYGKARRYEDIQMVKALI